MKKKHLFGLSLLAGLIFSLSWPLNGLPFLLFFAFIPLFFVDDYLLKNKKDFGRFSVFFFVFPAFLLFNVLVGYWVMNSTFGGGIGALTFNATLMAITFTVYHISRRNLYGPEKGHFLLIFFWITFELFHLNWELSFPWLNLGNGFAMWHKWIQWYEFTGTLGGTFWVLVVNLLIYKFILRIKENKSFKRTDYFPAAGVISVIIIPIIVSLFIYYQYEEKEDPLDIVIVQPNLDPYSEQYGLDPQTVIERITILANEKMDADVDFMICPESANQENMFENRLEYYTSNRMLRNYMTQNFPSSKLIIGASTYKTIHGIDTLHHAARKFRKSSGHYFAYNAAMYFEGDDAIQIYHKSKLTPGVEMMPSWGILRPLERLAIDMGGTIGTLKTDEERKNFITKDAQKLATIICYESIYGEFTSKFVRNGAQAIFIITNDGWWGDSPGYKQHFSMAKLRAIENRRSIARSANTGISAFINQRGDVIQQTDYWVKDVIRNKINLNDELTFYTKNGNYIARISALVSVLFLLLSISLGIKNKRKTS